MLKDRVAGFVLTDAVLGRYPNESGAIAYLQVGLGYLDQQVEQVEARLRKKLREAETVTWLGHPPWPKDVPRELLTCAFHWYATSACHLVKLIGWLHQQVDAAAPDPEECPAPLLRHQGRFVADQKQVSCAAVAGTVVGHPNNPQLRGQARFQRRGRPLVVRQAERAGAAIGHLPPMCGCLRRAGKCREARVASHRCLQHEFLRWRAMSEPALLGARRTPGRPWRLAGTFAALA
jgi:hypothetical protein